MFEKGSYIVYGGNGVCRVADIGPIGHIKGYDAHKDYYRLESVHMGGVIYVPTDTHAPMRKVISREEAEGLLAGIRDMEPRGCASRDPRVLREHYQSILATHSPEELLRLIKAVNRKGRQAAQSGKRLGKTDQDYKKRAESLLCQELSVAMELDYQQALELLNHSLRSASEIGVQPQYETTAPG